MYEVEYSQLALEEMKSIGKHADNGDQFLEECQSDNRAVLQFPEIWLQRILRDTKQDAGSGDVYQ